MALRSFLQLLSIIMLMGWVAPLSLPPMVIIMLGFYMLFIYYQVSYIFQEGAAFTNQIWRWSHLDPNQPQTPPRSPLSARSSALK